MNTAVASSFQILAGRRYLKSNVVMELLGYQNRAAFWEFIRSAGVPHVRLNARRIMFEEQALSDWLQRHASNATTAASSPVLRR